MWVIFFIFFYFFLGGGITVFLFVLQRFVIVVLFLDLFHPLSFLFQHKVTNNMNSE